MILLWFYFFLFTVFFLHSLYSRRHIECFCLVLFFLLLVLFVHNLEDWLFVFVRDIRHSASMVLSNFVHINTLFPNLKMVLISLITVKEERHKKNNINTHYPNLRPVVDDKETPF